MTHGELTLQRPVRTCFANRLLQPPAVPAKAIFGGTHRMRRNDPICQTVGGVSGPIIGDEIEF